MSAVVHLINALIAVSVICIWESGHRKTFQDILMIPSQQELGLQFEVLAMPAVMISGCVFLVVSTTIAFIFTCQTNFEEKENDKGKKFFRRMTRMTLSGRNVPKTKKSSFESFQSEQSKPSSKSSEANKKQNGNSLKKIDDGSETSSVIINRARKELRESKRESSTSHSSGEFIMQSALEKQKIDHPMPKKTSSKVKKSKPLDTDQAIADIVAKVDPSILKDMIEDLAPTLSKPKKLPLDNYV